jgi:uncharacterized protein (DUF433 family)
MNASVVRNPNVMHGEPCFVGTRVTVKTFFDHLRAGYSINDFLSQFPTVRPDVIQEFLTTLSDHSSREAVAA